MNVVWYAHSAQEQDKSNWERLEVHLANVALRTKVFASAVGAGTWGEVAGRLHDLGKSCSDFQRRLEGERRHADHKAAGAQKAVESYGIQGRILANCILGHHGGLPDLDELCAGIEQQKAECDLSLVGEFPALTKPMDCASSPFGLSFFTRYLHSCLIDADCLETEAFYVPDLKDKRHHPFDPETLLERLNKYLRKFGPPSTPVGIIRSQVLERCRMMAAEPQGFFSLTVPTGGGKTLSSLAFALNHAKAHQLSRVIYVIPYTSIIEQTAEVFCEALGADQILEHHSNFDPVMRKDVLDDDLETLRLAGDNWDAPIVVTTNVQFFESLFAAKNSRLRKLHNMANAVIILDEAQLLPLTFLDPCLRVLETLVKSYGATVVLCTATQPALNRSDWLKCGIEGVREIVEAPEELHASLRRVDFHRAGPLSLNDLAALLGLHQQALTVVDSRNQARDLFMLLEDEPGNYHLSARMCPQHRSQTIAEIKTALKDGMPCRVVSTNLVEAGVDLDFPVVFRAMAGLDSLIQAAGRCNRNGKLPDLGRVHVFELEGGSGWGSDQVRRGIAKEILDESLDALSPSVVRRYFERLYNVRQSDLDKEGVLETLLADPKKCGFNFRSAADKFRLIEEKTQDIIVPWDDKAFNLVEQMRSSERPQAFLRQLQRYTVQLYTLEVASLAGGIETINERFKVLVNMERYHPRLGLQPTELAGGQGIFA